jgi:Flp pilus assembly pilin Flp
MLNAVAGAHVRMLALVGRIRRDERGQGTVEYVGLAMAVGVLLLAVSSFLGGQDHGLGSIITGAIKSAVQRAAGGGK